MDELSNDVDKIVDDYFEVIDGDILLPDVLDYTMSILQLVNDRISVWSPIKKKMYNPRLMQEEFGINASNYLL